MANKDFKIKNVWVKLEDLVDIQADTEYYIQNKGQFSILCNNTATEPQPESKVGDVLLPNHSAKYVSIPNNFEYLKCVNTGNENDFSTITINDKM